MLTTNFSLTHHGLELKIYNASTINRAKIDYIHRKPLYFVASIVGTGNREGKFE